MIRQDNIDQFYKDVQELKLKFPIAAIAKATGESKGNVSRYLSKKQEPSEPFLIKFYDSFKIVPRGTPDDMGLKVAVAAEGIHEVSYLPEYIASLKEHNAFLQDIVKINLASLSDTQRVILAQVKAGLQFEARKIGQGSKKKEEAVLKDLNTLVASNLQAVSNVGSKVGEGM